MIVDPAQSGYRQASSLSGGGLVLTVDGWLAAYPSKPAVNVGKERIEAPSRSRPAW